MHRLFVSFATTKAQNHTAGAVSRKMKVTIREFTNWKHAIFTRVIIDSSKNLLKSLTHCFLLSVLRGALYNLSKNRCICIRVLCRTYVHKNLYSIVHSPLKIECKTRFEWRRKLPLQQHRPERIQITGEYRVIGPLVLAIASGLPDKARPKSNREGRTTRLSLEC